MKAIDTILLAIIFWTVWQSEMILLTLTTDFRIFIYGSFILCIIAAYGVSKTSVIKE